MTRQRSMILEELKKMNSHPTADELYEIVRSVLPNISLGTVYRNLDILSDMGQIVILEIDGNKKRFDGNIEKHYHIHCINCNSVTDINMKTVKIDYSQDTTKGCNIIDHRIHFIGLCEECSKHNNVLEAETGTSGEL